MSREPWQALHDPGCHQWQVCDDAEVIATGIGSEAEARLLAAAPGMLHELEASEEAWLAVGRAIATGDTTTARAIISNRIKEVRAAIAKATGAGDSI